MRQFSIIEHTADTGIDCRADSLKELFRAGAEGLRFILLGDSPVSGDLARKLKLSAGKLDELFREWLAELLYLFESEGFILCSCEFVRLDANNLLADLSGVMFDPAKHTLQAEVKAVTWHALKVERCSDGTCGARVILDL